MSAQELTRRNFLLQTGCLTLGFLLELPDNRAIAAGAISQVAPSKFAPNAFVRIGSDSSVTVISKHLEMGQGTFTGLATLLADELDADWSQVRVEAAPADAKRYANLLMGVQMTGGSTAMANAHEQMRTAGATARAILVAAAAKDWGIRAERIRVRAGVVSDSGSTRSTRFGGLVATASTLPVPTSVVLKDPAHFTLIGKPALRRKDTLAKTDGTARFTQDFTLPGMLIAVTAHPPRFGAKVKSCDATAAKAIRGVVAVVQFAGSESRRSGVAVLATNTWIAKKGRDALKIEWDETRAFKLGSEEIFAKYRALANEPGLPARNDGDAAAVIAGAPKVLSADYEVPYLAHASMEPLNCAVRLSEGRCEIWNGVQAQTSDQMAVANLLGIATENVEITQLYAGGSFGRRGNPNSDYVLEAVEIARALAEQGRRVPIKMVWMREDDMRAGYYRPAFLHRIRVALDRQAHLVAWHQRAVGQSIMKGTPLEAFGIQNGIDSSSIEGSVEPYAIPNVRIELHTPEDVTVPVQFWRSVGHSHTAFATESMIDEAAAATNKDPVEFRRALLKGAARHLRVLDLAAQQAGWGTALKRGSNGELRGRGIAVHQSFDTFVCEVAEVSVRHDGKVQVDRVVCAVDCGLAINPDIVRAQMEGGIGYGLAAALHGEITLQDGRVVQSNFHQYVPLRINEMPTVEVHIVPSSEKPAGVGEPGTAVIAAAVGNAIFAATGKRIRKLPIGEQLRS